MSYERLIYTEEGQSDCKVVNFSDKKVAVIKNFASGP